MCDKTLFTYQNQLRQVCFGNLNAQLPVVMRNGETTLIPWGRPRHTPSQLPLGATVQLDAIYQGHWDRYFPKPVKLSIKAFSVKDHHHQARWFHLPSDKWIQGLLVHEYTEIRVYVVILPLQAENPFPVWPRILVG